MFVRKVIKEMDEWFSLRNIKKKALVIRGARQIGKTTIALDYAKRKFKNVIYINFMTDLAAKNIFNISDLDVDKLLVLLTAYFSKQSFIPYETVMVFDEIQECPNARTSIKSFMIDGRFDIIATGSLLGIRGYNKNELVSIPTGFEYFINMKSLDFEEYLLARGISKEIIELLVKNMSQLSPIDNTMHELMLKYFREYIVVGGMPEIVDIFLKTSDMSLVHKLQQNILEEYKDDFGKHLGRDNKQYVNKTELAKILAVYNTIPSQLAKENKKFQFSLIKKDARIKEYYDALIWLCDAGIVSICNNLNTLDMPLDAYKIDEQFKIYFNDTGLLISMFPEGTASSILNGDLGIYKGAIYENIVADMLVKNNKKLYYYSKNSGLELDFVIELYNNIIPLEVKATDGRAKSLKEVITNAKYNVSKAIKLSSKNIGFSNNIINIPYYLTFIL